MKRVVVLMSGGVDSSVTAALLKQQGYDVIGVYILGWQGTKEFPCSWQKEELDARAVADKLGIAFITVNLTEQYKKSVIDEFFSGYKKGLTPNPDILCNREIKFKALLEAVRQLEPDFVATGHYARVIKKGKSYFIGKGIDSSKDQSYFLWGIDQSVLPKVLMPLGELTKVTVRKLACEFKLPTATKKDSQGVCFIGPLKVRKFLQTYLAPKPGRAVLKDGRVIATHEGAALYTIGQRLAAGSVTWTGDAPPLFVIAKDIKKNLLLVGSDSETFSSKLTAINDSWFIIKPTKKFEALAKIRYRQEDVKATIIPLKDSIRVEFVEPVRAVTPGQSIVFYDSNALLLGGAVIADVAQSFEFVRKAKATKR